MKTLYKFYLNDKKNPESLVPYLYGFTDKKDLYKRFKETRNMDKFSIIKDEIDKDELFILKHKYYGLELKEIILKTRNLSDPTKVSKIVVVGTRREEEDVIHYIEDLFNFISRSMKIPIDCFTEKYQKILKTLGYDKIYNWSRMVLKDLDIEYCYIGGEENRRLTEDFSIDEFSVFMEVYGGTLKLNKNKE